MDTNRDIYGSELHMPSGAEVEAATLHVPVGETRHPPERSGMRSKLDDLKSQSLSKVEQVKSNVTRSVALVKSNVTRSVRTARSSLRDETSTRMADLHSSMRSSPMKWAGIAAGTGFGLGLLGRFIHWRSRHQHAMPSLVVIERSY